MGDSADKISWKSNQTLDTSPSDVSLENHKKVREERVEVPKARGPGDPPPPFCPSLPTLCTLSSPSQPPPLSQYDPVSTHPFPLSTSLHQPFPLWPPLPVPAAPALPGKWGILAKGAALTRSSPALPSPPPLGRLDHKARAAASGVQQPAPHRRLRTAPLATCAARRPWPRGQHPVPGRATPHSPRGAEESPCRPHAPPPSSCCTWSCSRGSGRAPRAPPRVSGLPGSPLHLARRRPEIA